MMALFESALRSVLLGVLVGALLKLGRVRDTGTETLVWTSVLIMALSMPLLSHCMPRLVVAVPHLSGGPPLTTAPQPAGPQHLASTLLWLGRYGQAALLTVYWAGLGACLARLVIGLVLTWRLYQRAVPVREDWARGLRIRTSPTLKSPASLAHTILLPADFAAWSAAKRQAVLAHEAAHIARGDFYVQLAACVHCTVFWFSPFAWWLRSKLGEVAESASDEAAARRLDDPVMYAEILLEVARGAGGAPLIVAMAKGPLIQQRIDRLLCAAPHSNLSLPSRMIVMAVLTLVALTVATTTAAVGQNAASAPSRHPIGKAERGTSGSAPAHLVRSAPERGRRSLHRATALAAPAIRPVAAIAQDRDGISYNPRALLDPVYTARNPYVPASTIDHAGKTFYIRSTERVVADVSPADRMYRSAQ